MAPRLAQLAARAGTLFHRVTTALVGHVSWQPPAWLRALSARLLAYPIRSALVFAALLCAIVAARYAYLHRPIPIPPRLVHATISTPETPALADKLTPSCLRIHFDASAAALAWVDKQLTPGQIEMDPPLPGLWRWEGDRTLAFRLAGEWPAAQTLRVTLPPALLSPTVHLADHRLETRTPPLDVRFTRAEFYQNPLDLKTRQVTATILTTHAVTPAELTRHLSTTMLGNSAVFGSPPPAQLFTLTPGRHGREFFLRTVPLTLPPESDTMKLVVAADLPALAGGHPLAFDITTRVTVPDANDFFRVAKTSTQVVKDKDGNPHQLLLLETSSAIRTEDLAKFLTVYALPADNPARAAERQSAAHDAADNDDGKADSDTTTADSAASDPDDDADDSDDEEGGESGSHYRRFADDAYRHHLLDKDAEDDADTEAPDKVDAPHRPDAWSAAEVDAPALARSRRLEFTVVPTEQETSTTHTFRVRDDRPGSLFVKLSKDVVAPGDYKLRDDYTDVLPVPIPDKEITIQGDGGLLALGGERKLSVLSRGLPALRYEIARVPAAAINHLASQTSGDFQDPVFRDDHFNEQDFARFSDETQPIRLANPVEANYSSFDFTSHLRPDAPNNLDREGLFFLTVSGWDPRTKKYVRGTQVTRFVLVTDLGVLVKRAADGTRDVFVASLTNGQPIAAATVTVLARNGVPLAEAATDPAGRASLPSLGRNPHDSREPVALVVRRGGDVAFLPYERANRRLDFSRFDTEGVVNRTGHELDAFVFTERGVYRPGDTLHVGTVIKQRDWNGALDGLPVETEVLDAREHPAQVKILTLPSSGFVEWTFDTTHDSPTGAYTLNVYLRHGSERGTLLGSKTVQVKEFLPDRLKLDVSLSRTAGPGGHGWVTPDDLRGLAVLKNLYGTAAEDRLVKAHLRLNPHAFAFKEFPDYTFFDCLRENKENWEGETLELGDQQTAADGTAHFDFDLGKFTDATYRLTFDAEGFEAEGGRGVEDLTGTLVSPLSSVVGWKADGDLNWITADGPGRTVEFIGVDRDLQRIPLENLTVHLTEQRWISVLTKDNDGNYRYESVRREYPVLDTPLPIPSDTSLPTSASGDALPVNPFIVGQRSPLPPLGALPALLCNLPALLSAPSTPANNAPPEDSVLLSGARSAQSKAESATQPQANLPARGSDHAPTQPVATGTSVPLVFQALPNNSVILSEASLRAQSKDLPPRHVNDPTLTQPIAALLSTAFSPSPTIPPASLLLSASSSVFPNAPQAHRNPQPATPRSGLPLPATPRSGLPLSPLPLPYPLPHATPGDFLLTLRDPENHPVARLEYKVVGAGQLTRSLEKNAELQVHLARDQYRAGDEIEISVTAPYAGHGLITLERERIYAHRWFTAATATSVQRITIPPDFDGTGYVNVSFVRALDSKEIFTAPLSYAVAPFTANLERRRLAIDLHAADHTKPGDPLAIHFHTDRPAKLVVFAVDQGILQVTKFPLPDPLAFQFRKSALTVRTSQIVDLLLPEFSLLRAAQSPGGDGDPGVLNPFRRVTEKPVVFWSGILDADATDRTVTYPVPDYFNGTLTVMAVAVSPDALGSVKTSVLCRNPFVLTPAVPTLAAPGDEFEVGLTVANGQPGSGPDARLTVRAEPGPGLQIVRSPTDPLRVPEGHEASTTFRVRALDRLGSTTLTFHATHGPETSRVHSTLSVRPAMPFHTVVASGSFPSNTTREVPVHGSGLYDEYRHLEADVSALPLGLARGLDRYLKEYPHGCSEQITSGAFARLALAGVADFGLSRAEAATQIAHTLDIERRRQNDQGGFGFWDASKTPDIDFVTAYVMHFLVEARADGYPVPDDVFNKGLDALRRCSTASPWSLRDARTQAYAIYLLTREGVVTTNQVLALRDYLDTYYKPRWPHDLTAVYLAASWQLLKKDDEARRLLDGYGPGGFDHQELWDFYSPLSADAQYFTVLARHFPDRLKTITARDFSHVTAPVGDGDFSTLSAAYAVLALKAYSQALGQNPPRLAVTALLAHGQEKPLPLEGTPLTILRGTFPTVATALRFRADGGASAGPGAFFQTVQSGFDRALPTVASARGIEVSREILDVAGKLPVTRVKLGDRVTVRLRLRALRSIPVTNVAVVDLLPGGFEVADDSLPPGVGTAGMDYVDVREDRAVFYGTAQNRVHEITYRLKPTARGEFTVPPIFAESMYDHTIQSVGPASHLTVVNAK